MPRNLITVLRSPLVAEVCLRCDQAATATKEALYMTALGVFAALVIALCIGYHLGQRGSTPSARWKTQTSRAMVGRLAVHLVFVLTARRLRRNVLVRRVTADVGRVRTLPFQLPGNACRGGVKQRQRDLPARRREWRRTRVGA